MEQILIEENGKNYLLKFEIKDENLSLVVNIVEKNCGAYEIRKNLDDWKKIHIIFGCFQNLEKIKDFFINAINKKDLKIKLS